MGFIFDSWCFEFLITLFSGLAALYVCIASGHNYWKKRGIKSVPVSNIFGNISECIFVKKPLRVLLRELYLQGEGEKMIGFYALNKPFLIARDPEVIKNILVKDFKYFSNRSVKSAHRDFSGNANIFTLRNPAWKVLRQRLSPAFTSSKIKSMFDLMLETTQDLDRHLKFLVKNDDWNVVEMKEVCEKFTIDVIGLTMFGMKLNALNDPNAEFRKEGSKHFQNSYTRLFSMLSLFFMPKLAETLGIPFFPPDIPTFFNRAIPEAMNERIKSGIKQYDILDVFIEMKEYYENEKSDLSYYFQLDGLISTGIVFFLGGFEPSASIMYFTLYELAKQPEIQNELRREILEALEETDGKITYDMVMSLSYLEMVISESLRKYPLLHFLDREADEDYQFSGTNITIEKGTPIIIPMTGVHMDPNYYPNPDVFDPERFSPENRKKIPSFAYLPFGEGPRNCIGMRVGQFQSKTGLMYILSKYEFSPCKETPIPLEYDCYTIFTKSRYDMKLNIRRVNAN